MTRTDDRVRMHVTDVRRIPMPDGPLARYVVLLAEDGGPARLQMWVGANEASSLALALADVDLPRPSSYRTVAALLAATPVRVVDVTVTDLVDGVFIARMDLDNGSSIDARPSDALNLALVLDAPIFVSRDVLRRHDQRTVADQAEASDGHEAIATEFATDMVRMTGPTMP